MSRAIKFRAWHSGKEGWLHETGCSIKGEVILLGAWLRVPLEELNDVVVEQFTGLHDKNGVQIYEGDIVALEAELDIEEIVRIGDDNIDWGAPPVLPSKVDVVEIRPPRYWLKNETFGHEGEQLSDPERSAVIGNIHENPDLLE